MIPGKSSSPAASMRRKLSEISCLTDFVFQPLSRSCFKVDGRGPADIEWMPPLPWLVAQHYYSRQRRDPCLNQLETRTRCQNSAREPSPFSARRRAISSLDHSVNNVSGTCRANAQTSLL